MIQIDLFLNHLSTLPIIVSKVMSKFDSIVISTQCRERFLDQQQFPLFSHWDIFLAGLSDLHHQYIISKQKMGYHVVVATLDGSGVLSIPGRARQTLEKGDMLLVPADKPFRYELNAEKHWKTAWLMLEPSKAWQHFPCKVTVQKNARWTSSFSNILEQLNAESIDVFSDSKEMARLLCEQLYLLVGRHIRSGSGFESAASQRLKQLINEIEMSPSKSWTLAEMCQYCHYSRAQITRLFNQHFGQSPSRKVMQIKMRYAALMLRTTALSIKQIAPMVGFDNAYNFSSRFKQSMACAPSVYRQKHVSTATTGQLA